MDRIERIWGVIPFQTRHPAPYSPGENLLEPKCPDPPHQSAPTGPGTGVPEGIVHAAAPVMQKTCRSWVWESDSDWLGRGWMINGAREQRLLPHLSVRWCGIVEDRQIRRDDESHCFDRACWTFQTFITFYSFHQEGVASFEIIQPRLLTDCMSTGRIDRLEISRRALKSAQNSAKQLISPHFVTAYRILNGSSYKRSYNIGEIVNEQLHGLWSSKGQRPTSPLESWTSPKCNHLFFVLLSTRPEKRIRIH